MRNLILFLVCLLVYAGLLFSCRPATISGNLFDIKKYYGPYKIDTFSVISAENGKSSNFPTHILTLLFGFSGLNYMYLFNGNGTGSYIRDISFFGYAIPGCCKKYEMDYTFSGGLLEITIHYRATEQIIRFTVLEFSPDYSYLKVNNGSRNIVLYKMRNVL